MITIKFFKLKNGKEPVFQWMKTLDKTISLRVLERLTRLTDGNFGDCKAIDSEISELRLKFGSGYRIYFSKIDDVVILFINAGDKSTQKKNIEKAREYLKQWNEVNND